MDFAAIFALILKGLAVIESAIQAGQEAAPAIAALVQLVEGAQKGSVSDEDLQKAEALLDQLISDFNADI